MLGKIRDGRDWYLEMIRGVMISILINNNHGGIY